MEGLKQIEAILLREEVTRRIKLGKIAVTQDPQLRHFPKAGWQVSVHIPDSEKALGDLYQGLKGLDAANVLVYNPQLVEVEAKVQEQAA
jgi:hypothetical protein